MPAATRGVNYLADVTAVPHGDVWHIWGLPDGKTIATARMNGGLGFSRPRD